ncbi:importin 11 [Moniliophthora roreri MCA 2997]|uniref:Importin 11 n=1 Tax=Moniliophthora roreri (strain MCA 2997) TaxID=1381753 RepID=V2XKX6_MONRO|nr:importin 11 [Moniliophthora roreri MCA 2997]
MQSPIPTQSPRAFIDLLLTDLVYKSLSNVASWLWQRSEKLAPTESENACAWVYKVFNSSAEQLRSLVAWRSSIISSNGPQASPFTDRLTKHIRHLGKFFRRLCSLSPKRFVEIPGSADVVLFYWNQITQAADAPPGSIDDNNHVLFPVRFLVQGMVMFKDTLGQYTAVRRDGTPNRNTLSQTFVEDAVRLIVTRFLPLNAKDLESWLADPEEWVNTEETENEHWEYELRACSERVLLQVSNQYPDYVAPLLQATFAQVAEQPATDLDSTLQKEALYCALGRCCRRLKDIIRFLPWVNGTLTIEARDTKGSAPILKRRIAWLLGKLMSDDCIDPNNPRIWEILVHLLGDRGEGTDAVVRLTAGVAIREGVDTLEFKMDSFRPYLPTAVTELMNLIAEVDSFDSKRRVDDALNVVIERAGPEMVPIVPAITGPLPGLWIDAGTNWLFKNSLLVTMTNLVKAIGPHSTSLSGTVVPLIEESMNEGMNLDTDGALLWKEAMRSTTSATTGNPSLSNLLPTAIRLLETNLDLLGSLLNIMESYFILNGEQILQLCAVDLFKGFLSIFTRKALRENQKGALVALHLLIQTTPSLLWAEPLHISGLFPYFLNNLTENETDPIILSHEIYLFSRIVMSHPQAFAQLMTAAAPQLKLTEVKAYELLMDQWWAQFDAMSEPRHRKLVAMGMTALVSTGRPDVLQRLPTEIFNLWLDVFGEIREARRDPSEFEGDETPANTLQRHWEQDDAPDEFYQGSQDTPEYDRRKRIWNEDPVRTTQLSSYVAAGLRAAESTTGSQNFHNLYLAKTDPEVLKQIQSEITNAK